ncbi:MAG: hypothetical protein Kow0063_10500 [Anaerolineae bacterium]
MKRWVLAILLVLSMGLPSITMAQGSIRVLDQNVETAFRDYITFNIDLESDSPIVGASLFYRVSGQLATARGDAEIEPDTRLEASFTIDQERDYLPPGTGLEYWWKITDEAGNELKTEPQELVYMDERYDWQVLSSDRLALYWYRGDRSFGEALFDQANRTLDQIEAEAGVRVETPVKIFIYGSFSDLRDAIAVGSQEWTGGQAFTEQGVVVIGVSPGDLDFGLAATPHELTHLVIHQATDNPYGDIPRWLDEGLAVYMSGELDTGWRGYREQVTRAARGGRLMTLQTLSSSFPADSEQAGLAYAQSGSVVEFIIQHYGEDAMARLLDIFSEGALYDEALEQALGVDTWELDNAWRESIGAPALDIPTISTSETAPVAEESEPAPTEAPSETGTTEEQPSAPRGGGLALPCLGSSLVGAAMVGLFLLFRPRGSMAG